MSLKLKKKNDLHNSRRKIRLNKKVFIPLLIIIIGIISFSSYKIFSKINDKNKINDIMENIGEEAPVINLTLEDGAEMVNPPSKNATEDRYWDFINRPLKDVDFTELLQKNDETVGYMVMDNTIIDYPIVQHIDNDFYLTHDFNKKKNGSGWVFADYRDRFDDLKHNTIVYAHGGTDSVMFGPLKKIVESGWYEQNKDTAIYISTPKENMLWQIVSVYSIPTETYYLTSNFGTNESHQKFINTIINRSMFDFKTKLDINDKILTLSTCLNDDIKIVVHAKLIKRMAK